LEEKVVGFKRFIALIGRLFLSFIFILSAVNKIFNWQKTESGLVNLFCDWQTYVHFSTTLSKFFSVLISWVPEILIVITIIEVVAALLVFFGIKEKFGAFLLLIFFVPATFMLHPFWFMSGAKRSFQTIMFMKNIAIAGSLLLLMVLGSKIKSDSENHEEENIDLTEDEQ
jgi:putative oxidoreductase